MKKAYNVRFIDQNEDILYYPAEVSFSDEIHNVSFGSIMNTAVCKPNPTGRNEIVLSSALKEKLLIPDIKMALHLFFRNGTVYLGPLIGIFTSGFTTFQMRPIGNRSLFFAKLMSVHKQVGAIPFVFGEQHINWDKGVIKGFFYHENGWENYEVPFPNVIYDRLPNRKSENRAIQKAAKERLQQEYLIPWYNPGFFNKLEVNDVLSEEDSVVKYLPETYPFTSFSMIEKLLGKYGHIYMKPINGSLGFGVHQLLYDKKEGSYYCRFRNQTGENKLRKFTTLEALIRNIFQNRRLERMLVQQGIDLLRIDKRPVDFRVHTNKNEDGVWKVSAIAAKIAGAGSPTTHIKSGGAVLSMDEAFKDEQERHKTIENLSNAAKELSEALEKHMDGIIAEIGFDLGIDQKGNVWLFEANSKPGRSIFSHPKLKEFDLLTRKLSLAFSIFLTEKSISEPEELFK